MDSPFRAGRNRCRHQLRQLLVCEPLEARLLMARDLSVLSTSQVTKEDILISSKLTSALEQQLAQATPPTHIMWMVKLNRWSSILRVWL